MTDSNNNTLKVRLDEYLLNNGLTQSRSQAANLIKLGRVSHNGKIVTKPGTKVLVDDKVKLVHKELYVSRAGLKLSSVAKKLNIDFRNKTVLDVGSSTGGFTDYALKHGATKVLAVDVGTNQLHASLHGHPKIELHEKTDIRDFKTNDVVDIVLIDVSFISLKEIIPDVLRLMSSKTLLVAMAKPQFESGDKYKHKGVVKNEKMRRQILVDLEVYFKNTLVIIDKADSEVSGNKGNTERFYLLKKAL